MPTSRIQHPRYRALALTLALAALVAACGDDPSSPADGASLDGFVSAQRNDSTGGPPPDTVAEGPGRFKGIVRGYTPGAVDTTATLVVLGNVKVTAYEYEGTMNQPALRDPVAQTFSDLQGRFELPTLPGGNYVVTFVPPASSGYRPGWTIGWAWPRSGDNDWQIHLPKAP